MFIFPSSHLPSLSLPHSLPPSLTPPSLPPSLPPSPAHTDPYVKVYLIYKGKRLGKWKTKVKKNTLVPVFNESFQFLVPGLNPRDLMLQVVVMDYDRFSRNDHVGIVDLGCDVSNDGGRKHWQEILENPREPISHWHPILPGKKKGGGGKGGGRKGSLTASALPMCLGSQR